MRKICFVLGTFLALTNLNAQDTTPIDTIALARNKAYAKDFFGSDKLLIQYNSDHTNVDALRLHAQVLYWMKEFDRAKDVYEKALRLFPQVYAVQLDYARVLFEMNRLAKAQDLLKQYIEKEPANAEANIMLARIELWNGRIASAKKRAAFLLQKYPGNPQAIDINNQIQYLTAPYLSTGIRLLSDDQPLTGTDFGVEAGTYRSWLVSPVASANIYQFKFGDSSFHSGWFRLGNTIQLGLNSTVRLGGGIFQQNSKEMDGTGVLEFSQKIDKAFLLQAGFERRPYQYSAASIKTPVLEDVASFSLNYNLNNKWLGKAGYEAHSFQDHGTLNSGFVWLLAPIVFRTNFSLNGGYSFSASGANKNNFIPSKSLTAVFNSIPVNGTVPGIYSPYFTPQNQQVHSALAAVRVGLTPELSFAIRASVAIIAKADNPVMTLQKTGTQYSINKAFYPIDYNPVTVAGEMRLLLSNKLSLTGAYNYDHLLFYTANQGSLHVKYLFLK